MKLRRLQMKNFRSFAEADLDLNVEGLIAVVGPNGAGKSTIFEAVEWALFGGKRGTGAMQMQRQGSVGEPCWVELEFEAGGRAYCVRRVDRKDAKLIDLESGQELATTLMDTSRQAAATLGLTHEMFCGTFYARQREVQALVDSKRVSERREQLERLLGIEHLRQAAERARSDAKEQKTVCDALTDQAPDIETLKSEIERTEREAQQAPVVKTAEQEVVRLRAESKATNDQLDELNARAQEQAKWALSAEKVATTLGREQTTLNNLLTQLETARSAVDQLESVGPVAARVDELLAKHREMDLRRSNHEQAVSLREQHRTALATVASLTDELKAQSDSDGDPLQLSVQISDTQANLAKLADSRREASTNCQRADALVLEAEQTVSAAETRETLNASLVALGDPKTAVETAEKHLSGLREERATATATLAQDVERRDALRAGGDSATCPTCKQPFKVSYAELLADCERKITSGRKTVKALDREIKDATTQNKATKDSADRARTLQVQLDALGNTGEIKKLRQELTKARAAATKAAAEEQQLESQYTNLNDALPELRKRAEQAASTATKRSQLEAARASAEHDTALFADQLTKVGANNYDAEAHAALNQELAEAEDASRRCAVLRASAESVELLDGRATKQKEFVDSLVEKYAALVTKTDEIVIDPEQQLQLQGKRDSLEDELHTAQTRLAETIRKAEQDSQALKAARKQLQDGRRRLRKLSAERREYQWREAVAQALADYRADASQRVRPVLDEQASRLLHRVSSGRYGAVRLDDSYQLQVADDRELHPLKRFSGGEQDLTSLCLRLALSRTLAEQRGVEAGFVILDEVFGSQDSQRREALLQQLGELAEHEFRQVFVISHVDDVIHHCQLHIDVSRTDGQPSIADGPKAR